MFKRYLPLGYGLFFFYIESATDIAPGLILHLQVYVNKHISYQDPSNLALAWLDEIHLCDP